MTSRSGGSVQGSAGADGHAELLVEIELEVTGEGGVDPDRLPDDVIETVESLGDLTVEFACTSVTSMSE